MYPVASAIKVVLHRAFRASAISRVTLANNFFKTSVLCACQGFPTCVCMCVCVSMLVCVWLVWIVSMYLRESFVTSCKGTCMHTSLFRQLLQTVDARPHVNTVKKFGTVPSNCVHTG